MRSDRRIHSHQRQLPDLGSAAGIQSARQARVTRRGLIFAVLAAPLCADDSSDVWALLSQVAAALAQGNVVEFLQAFDRNMPGYQTLETDVSALVREYEVGSTIEPLNDEGEGETRTVELDWFLELVEQQDETNITRRRDRVRCRVVKTGKNWKITSLDPLSFFAPPEGKI
jgi:hypothetical protein